MAETEVHVIHAGLPIQKGCCEVQKCDMNAAVLTEEVTHW